MIKKLGIIGMAIIIVVLGCEFLFASWLQDAINSAIPHNEWYNIIHLCTIIVHIWILGGLYLAIAILTALFVLYLAESI